MDLTVTYHDPDGWRNIYLAQLLVNDRLDSRHAFYIYYDACWNRIYMMNDAGTAWLGGFRPGSSHSIENSQAILDLFNTSVSGDGNTLSLKLRVTFKDNFVGTRRAYQLVKDFGGIKNGWNEVGTWTINGVSSPPMTKRPPILVPLEIAPEAPWEASNVPEPPEEPDEEMLVVPELPD